MPKVLKICLICYSNAISWDLNVRNIWVAYCRVCYISKNVFKKDGCVMYQLIYEDN